MTRAKHALIVLRPEPKLTKKATRPCRWRAWFGRDWRESIRPPAATRWWTTNPATRIGGATWPPTAGQHPARVGASCGLECAGFAGCGTAARLGAGGSLPAESRSCRSDLLAPPNGAASVRGRALHALLSQLEWSVPGAGKAAWPEDADAEAVVRREVGPLPEAALADVLVGSSGCAARPRSSRLWQSPC